MRGLPLLVAAVAALAATASGAQTPATTPTRVAGTVESFAAGTLTVKTREGPPATVTLAPDAAIYGLKKSALSDLKPGDFVASGGVKGSDGRIHAVELRIFPEALRGTGEGQRPWDAKPEGVMTNATVGTVTQAADGGVVHVTYKGGESEYLVGPEVPIVTYVAGDTSLLKPGAAVFMVAQKKPDGSLGASRVTAEKDGVKPPM